MSGGLNRIWFLDTASLLSMAVDDAIAAAVLDEVGDDPVMIIDIVADELRYRATQPETAQLAATALAAKKPGWIDVDTDTFVTLEDVLEAQEDVADGRAPKDDRQHWAESTIIAMGRRSAAAGHTSIKVLLSEDYDARRVAATVPNMTGVSLHGLLHHRVHAHKMTAERAGELAAMLTAAGRAQEVTAEEFADPSGRLLGRAGRPAGQL